ncbi:MAG: ATP-binding cassette domain-containing protein, partial [Rhodobacteraceae bacterium]|nr:ATP-binding cassette domain-containing protein [Paracoccaceae bacterium]
MSDPIIELKDTKLHYKIGNAVSAMMGLSTTVKAVDGVSFSLRKGESVGLLGESGCGKTSMGRILVRLEEITGGSARFEGDEIGDLKGSDLQRFRSRSQMIFQNPFDAVNPRYSIRKTLEEPLANAKISRSTWHQRIIDALDLVGLGDPEQF